MTTNTYSVTIIFGKESILKLDSGIKFTEFELNENIKKYSFESEKELKAFIHGIDEAIGWIEVRYFINDDSIDILSENLIRAN